MKTEILSSTFVTQNGMKLEISYEKKNWKIHKYMETKQHANTGYCTTNQLNQKNEKKVTWGNENENTTHWDIQDAAK